MRTDLSPFPPFRNHILHTEYEYDRLMQRIGEFVVSFQWLEDKFRDIGWLIEDPTRMSWPPKTLRNLTNFDLLNNVERAYLGLVDSLNIDNAEERKAAFQLLVSRCHEIRKYRNNLLHSAYVEMKSHNEVIGVIRSNPRINTTTMAGDTTFDYVPLTADSVAYAMKDLAAQSLALSTIYIELLHMAPFTQ